MSWEREKKDGRAQLRAREKKIAAARNIQTDSMFAMRLRCLRKKMTARVCFEAKKRRNMSRVKDRVLWVSGVRALM